TARLPSAYSRHRRPVTALPYGSASNKSQPGVVEIIPVKVIDAHGRRAGPDKTVDDEGAEQPHGAHVPVSQNVTAHVAAGVRQSLRKSAGIRLREEQQPDVFKHKSAQDHHAGSLLANLPVGVEVTHTGHPSHTVAIDAKNFAVCPQVKVAGLDSHGNRGVKRGGLGVHMTAVEIAVTAIQARRTFADARVKRSGAAARRARAG